MITPRLMPTYREDKEGVPRRYLPLSRPLWTLIEEGGNTRSFLRQLLIEVTDNHASVEHFNTWDWCTLAMQAAFRNKLQAIADGREVPDLVSLIDEIRKHAKNKIWWLLSAIIEDGYFELVKWVIENSSDIHFIESSEVLKLFGREEILAELSPSALNKIIDRIIRRWHKEDEKVQFKGSDLQKLLLILKEIDRLDFFRNWDPFSLASQVQFIVDEQGQLDLGLWLLDFAKTEAGIDISTTDFLKWLFCDLTIEGWNELHWYYLRTFPNETVLLSCIESMRV